VRAAVDGELQLLDPEVRAFPARVLELLDPEFAEFGASGRRGDVESVLEVTSSGSVLPILRSRSARRPGSFLCPAS
jgi:hypothetical protein